MNEKCENCKWRIGKWCSNTLYKLNLDDIACEDFNEKGEQMNEEQKDIFIDYIWDKHFKAMKHVQKVNK